MNDVVVWICKRQIILVYTPRLGFRRLDFKKGLFALLKSQGPMGV